VHPLLLLLQLLLLVVVRLEGERVGVPGVK